MGLIWAAISGIGSGLFQAFNLKAMQGNKNPYQTTLALLIISSIVLVTSSIFSEDQSQISQISLTAFLNFGLAGFINFFLGWTFLSLSQIRIGAARTGVLVGLAPLFALIVGLVFFDEYLNVISILGIFTVIGGAYIVSTGNKGRSKNSKSNKIKWTDSFYALGTAICFASSAIFIRAGLIELDSPLLGVTIGATISAAAYGLLLFFRRGANKVWPFQKPTLLYLIVAGVLVGLSTWTRWIALDLAPIGIVLALGRLNILVVLWVAPLLVGREQEQVNSRIWVGAVLIVVGSLLIILFG